MQREIAQAFREAGLRATSQRSAVLEFLARTPVHATAEEIFTAINRHDPRASRATVYNSLRSLEKAGLVREVISDGKAGRFDANLHRHHHFVCEVCGSVEDVPWFEMAPPGVLGTRRVRDYEIVFRGACARCCNGARK
ncbi:MAG: transcriptional repressor [Acidobacteriota bacterium]|nr:transcriptional repressor [Acidobacteriota bacterium]